MPTKKFYDYFNNYIPLEEIEKKWLDQIVVIKNIKRRQFILQESNICVHYTFVVSGLFKMYDIDANGIEHNVQFSMENEWIMDMASLHGNIPSKMCIEALEDAVIVQIEKHKLHNILSNSIKLERCFRVIIENRFIALEARMLQNISVSAEKRYVSFKDNYPILFNRLPNTEIASYLGITPEFLSKVRKNISQKK